MADNPLSVALSTGCIPHRFLSQFKPLLILCWQITGIPIL